MNNDTLYTAILSLISAVGLWWLVFWLYRDYCVDWFRQEMFLLRDDLFDFAASGGIDFKDPAYGILRTAMNGFIRFGHRLSLGQVLLFLIIHGRPETRFGRRWDASMNGLDVTLRAHLENNYIRRMHSLVLKRLALGSPILVLFMVFTIVVPILFWVVGRFYMDRLLSRFDRMLGRIDAAALVMGH